MSRITYNTGDIVVIKPNLPNMMDAEEDDILSAPGIAPEMLEFAGSPARIMMVAGDLGGPTFYRLDIDGGRWSWSVDYFVSTDSAIKKSVSTTVNIHTVKVGQYIMHKAYPIHVRKFVFKVLRVYGEERLECLIVEPLDGTKATTAQVHTFSSNSFNGNVRDAITIDEDDDALMFQYFGVTNYPENYKDLEKKLPIPNFFKDSKYPVKKLRYDNDDGINHVCAFILTERPRVHAVTFDKGRSVTIKVKYLVDLRNTTGADIKEAILDWSRPKIKSVEGSIALFGHKTRKTAMFEQSNNPDHKLRKDFKLTNIIYNYEKEGKYYHVVELFDGSLNLKFLLDDIDLRLPDIKNYNPPMDRTIQIGSECKVIKDKLLPVKKGSTIKVHKIFNRHKPTMGRKYDKNSIAVAIDKNTGRTFECRIKQLKKIECKKQEAQELPF